jgi:hypothetical protein
MDTLQTNNITSCVQYFEARIRDQRRKDKVLNKMQDEYYSDSKPELTDYAKKLVDKQEVNKAMKEKFGFCLTTEAERLLSKS